MEWMVRQRAHQRREQSPVGCCEPWSPVAESAFEDGDLTPQSKISMSLSRSLKSSSRSAANAFVTTR